MDIGVLDTSDRAGLPAHRGPANRIKFARTVLVTEIEPSVLCL